MVGHEHYFNGGLLYLNLKKMREDNISEKLIEYKKNDKCNVFMDQNCLNAIMGDNAVWLPPKFNLGPYEIKKYNANPKKYLSYFANFYGISEEEMKNTFEKPAILHLAGKKKVWKNVFADNFDIWIQYIDERDIPKCTISYLQSLREENIQLRKDLLKLKSHTLYGLLAKFYHLIKR